MGLEIYKGPLVKEEAIDGPILMPAQLANLPSVVVDQVSIYGNAGNFRRTGDVRGVLPAPFEFSYSSKLSGSSIGILEQSSRTSELFEKGNYSITISDRSNLHLPEDTRLVHVDQIGRLLTFKVVSGNAPIYLVNTHSFNLESKKLTLDVLEPILLNDRYFFRAYEVPQKRYSALIPDFGTPSEEIKKGMSSPRAVNALGDIRVRAGSAFSFWITDSDSNKGGIHVNTKSDVHIGYKLNQSPEELFSPSVEQKISEYGLDYKKTYPSITLQTSEGKRCTVLFNRENEKVYLYASDRPEELTELSMKEFKEKFTRIFI